MTTAISSLGDETESSIGRALSVARTGDLAGACKIAEQALAAGGEEVALNALLGMLRMDLGEQEKALGHLELAHAGRPGDIRVATNLATVLTKLEQFDRVLEVISADLASSDPTLQLARLRGYAAQMSDLSEQAVQAYEIVVRSAPDDWESWNNLGNARSLFGDFKGGIKDLERAVTMAPDSPPPRLNLARAHRRAGDLKIAEDILRKMADDFPDDVYPLIDLRDVLLLDGREHEILPVLDSALERDPDNIEVLLARARHFFRLLEMEKAEQSFRAVLARDPANGEAFVGLATVYEHSRADALPALAEEAEQQNVERNALNLVRAFAHRRAKRFNDGIAALALVDLDFEASPREHLVGQMLQGIGDYDGAFAAFERMNQLQFEDLSQPVERAAALRAKLRKQLAETTKGWVESWRAPPIEPDRRSPVFLVGFPRSGTTLLDTILMGNPEVAVMEERPVIHRLSEEIGGFDAIPSLDEPAIRDAQRRYFEIASEYVELGSGALLLDKSPLLLNHAALIYRLFPSAPFLLAIRHPADVLLSCYVSNFHLNDGMANFLRLDTAAEFYDMTFSAWENARNLLPFAVHTVVYEQMVEDPPAVLRPLVEYLGLEWHDDMLDHTKTAAERGVITTASYAQVTEPIYRKSVGRWLNYRKHLEPILPVLAPWAEKFGYSL